jgi:preprotein translocase subunit SecE
MEKITLYLKESYNELLRNVSWPTAAQLQESTLVVLVTAAMLALLIFGMDAICSLVFKTIYGVGVFGK